MPDRPPQYRPHPKRPAPSEAARGTAHQRGYGSRWQRFRLSFLAAHPLCAECERKGRTTEATVVDHVTPHRGDAELFWREGNHQALCARCHNAKTRSGA